MQKLILIGAGGYAKSVVDSIDYSRYEIAGFVDKNKFGTVPSHLGYPIISDSVKTIENPEQYVYFISIGGNRDRKHYYKRLGIMGVELINVIDKTAVVSEKAVLGRGIFVGKLAVINSCAHIEDDVIVNTRAIVEHGCSVGIHSNISTNSVINGDVFVGEGSFIGSCSVVNGQKKIGKGVVIGSGAVVIDDVEDYVTAVGIPAKIVKHHDPEHYNW